MNETKMESDSLEERRSEAVDGAGVEAGSCSGATAAGLYIPTTSSGTLVETRTAAGTVLRLVSSRPGGGFDYYRLPHGGAWVGPLASAGSPGNLHSPVLFLGRTRKDCLDAIVREVQENRDVPASESSAGSLFHTCSRPYTLAPPASFPWGEARTQLPQSDDVIGTPGVCTWNDSDQGVDVIAPLACGGLRHWYRTQGGGDWRVTSSVVRPDAANRGRKFKSCAMVKGESKKLDVLALDEDGCLWYVQRDVLDRWLDGTNLGSGFLGMPALVNGNRSGAEYDLVVPLKDGGLGHYALNGYWTLSNLTKLGGANTYREIGVALTAAGLEVVARTSYNTLEHYINSRIGAGWANGTPLPQPPDRSRKGSWNVELDTLAIGIHGAVLHTEEVLLLGIADQDDGSAKASLLDTRKRTVKPLTDVPHLFCSGHSLLANGDLLVAGGHTGHDTMLHVFERREGAWRFRKLEPDFTAGRWYPTCTTLPDGRVLILSGLQLASNQINNSYEIFDPESPTGARVRYDLAQEVDGKFCDDSPTIDMYPFVYLLPNQKLFVHSRYTTRFFTLPTTGKGTWGNPMLCKARTSRTYPWQGTSVLLPLKPDAQGIHREARVALFGGAPAGAKIDSPALDGVELIETSAASPQWVDCQQHLLQGRVMPDAVLLPDGKVLIVSGSRSGLAAGEAKEPELSAELFDPEVQTFTRLAPMSTPRLYHATAVLLPDATVLVTGKCSFFNPEPYKYPEHRGEVFTPPYLQTRKPRPVITAAPASIERAGAAIEIAVREVGPEEIQSVILIRPSSATHSLNMDQRAVVLTPPRVKNGKVEVFAPRSNWIVPPGYYMLFVISRDGVPSVARFVQVKILPA